ncbi:hypothetical protein V9T40_014194 [Parthenolecanium corni]|uniref:Uncharacterized protein n=1 Tax=Parthenolecanium corni TaxID=536013 RepID=A0AAN9TTF9_9HEMI
MLISTPSIPVSKAGPSASDAEPTPVISNTITTSKCSDFSVSSLCRDLKKTSKNSSESNDCKISDDAIIVGGLGSNWKPDHNVNFSAISASLPILNSVLPNPPSIVGKATKQAAESEKLNLYYSGFKSRKQKAENKNLKLKGETEV